MKQLALVVHFHQPVGNLDRVVQNATERCYRPFLEVLADHPEIPMTLHYSGCLLEWLEANATDVVETIGTLVERGQVELMTGGFYEPILAALPGRDQRGQIEMMSSHLARHYGADATGLWLAERVWEQDVVPALVDSGVRYTVVDDTMFHSVGLTDDKLKGPFVTEQDGKPLLVYAGDRTLRYLIPYKKVDRALNHLQAGADDRLFVYADDGEKFGEWPDTYERTYTRGWLDGFLTALREEEGLELTTLGAHALEARPKGRVYLPSSSYDEMMTWALPADARLTVGGARRRLETADPEGLLPFVRGAPWRAFLAKYPEVNQLQKRMLHVSAAVRDAGNPEGAVRELYRAQCNCAYWHGSFGGVYLSFMRTALWHHLMKAEGLVSPPPGIEVTDLDADARDEIVICAPWGAAVIATDDARLVELDERSFGANLLAVTARHREAYHLAEENPPADTTDAEDDDEMEALQARVDVDRDSLTFDNTALGGLIDLIDGERVRSYEFDVEDDVVRFQATIGDVRVDKRISASPAGLHCRYDIQSPKPLTFGVETSAIPLNLGRAAPNVGIVVGEDGWHLQQAESEVGLHAACTPGFELDARPIETASATLEGLQTMPQGITVTLVWHLPAGSSSLEIELIPEIDPEAGNKKEPGVSA